MKVEIKIKNKLKGIKKLNWMVRLKKNINKRKKIKRLS
jgi:hypothetical protein